MVIAPERPPVTNPKRTRSLRWVLVGVAVLAAGGLFMLSVLGSDDGAGAPGPAGPVGPQETPGPQGAVGPPPPGAVTGSGTVTTEVRDVPRFDTVVVAGEGDVMLRPSDTASVTILTDDNLLPFITTEVQSSALVLDATTDIDPTAGVVFEIDYSGLARLEITGAGTITTDGLIADALTIAVTGVGDVVVTGFEASQLTVDGTGVGSITIAGLVTTQEVVLAGVMSYDAGSLRSTNAVIDSSSAGDAVVWATHSLDARLRDVGDVDYYGNPELTRRTGGLGTVTALGDK